MENLLKFEYWVDFSLWAISTLDATLPGCSHPLHPHITTRTQISRKYEGEQEELLSASGGETFMCMYISAALGSSVSYGELISKGNTSQGHDTTSDPGQPVLLM